jgi:response regulator RpfG family c-di-GMP phosphodiesterase
MTSTRDKLGKPLILVVDDDPAVCSLLADGLDQFGYLTCVAHNAKDAMAIVELGSARLVLTDIDMPEWDGFALLERIKTHDEDIDVVMVTGATDAETSVRAIRRGASDYVTKPLNLEEVRIVVERTLAERRLVLENRAYQDQLEKLVGVRTQEVNRLLGELSSSYESTLHALMTALDFRDNETQGHSYRVVEYAVMVARRMSIEEPELTRIRRGAILHDVGKIGVSDAVLRKPSSLTDEEWAEMRRHPELGYRMLKDIPFLQSSLDIVLFHQERWDGTGYPQGLRGDQIPLGARIFAVVDTFDAMTSDRPYRRALSVPEAREEIARCSTTQFDPRIVEAFLAIDEASWFRIRDRVHSRISRLTEPLRFQPMV